MSINQTIREALLPICPDVQFLSFAPEESTARIKKTSRYFAFNYDALPIFFADDKPVMYKYLIQVHYYCPFSDNVTELINRTCFALLHAGLTMPEYIPIEDVNGKHIVFECESAEDIDYGEN